MKHISDLFSRYQNLIKPPQSSVTKVFIEVCGEEMGLTLSPTQCEYNVHSRMLFVKTPSVLKSEILKKKKALLSELKIRLGENNSPVEIL